MNDLDWLRIAESIALSSKDEVKVGCVITSVDRVILSTGYNGAPRCVKEHEVFTSSEEKKYWNVHAEANAIVNAARQGINLTSSIIYTTHLPCMDCAKLLAQLNVMEIVTYKPEEPFKSKWKESHKRALELFQLARIRVIQYAKNK